MQINNHDPKTQAMFVHSLVDATFTYYYVFRKKHMKLKKINMGFLEIFKLTMVVMIML
jgi:hypothetical protein